MMEYYVHLRLEPAFGLALVAGSKEDSYAIYEETSSYRRKSSLKAVAHYTLRPMFLRTFPFTSSTPRELSNLVHFFKKA